MVYSVKADPELLVRCMRAGAREFLTLPLSHEHHGRGAGARLGATAARRRQPKKAAGRLLAFLGAKGGDGVTTLACNFAVSLAKESGQSTLLIDLDLPLGDAALNLGIVAEYSTINALQNAAGWIRAFLPSCWSSTVRGFGAGCAGQVSAVSRPPTTRSTGCLPWRGRTSTTWSSIWAPGWI